LFSVRPDDYRHNPARKQHLTAKEDRRMEENHDFGPVSQPLRLWDENAVVFPLLLVRST